MSKKLAEILTTERTKKAIFDTNISGSKEINILIGNAIRKLRVEDVSFLSAEIYLEDLAEDIEGYLFEKNGKQIFIMWNQEKKKISELIFGQQEDSFEDEDIVQAILLLETVVDLTGEAFDFATHLPSLIHTDKIKKNSSLADLFMQAISVFENIALQDNYQYSNTSDDEFSINWSEKIPVIEEILQSKVIPTPVEVEEDTEKVDEKIIVLEEVPVEAEEVLVPAKEVVVPVAETEVEVKEVEVKEIEQLSFLDEEFVKVNHDIKPIKSGQKKRSAKKEVTSETTEAFTDALVNINDTLNRLQLLQDSIGGSAGFGAGEKLPKEDKKEYTKEDVIRHSKYILKNDEVIKYCEERGFSPKLIKLIKKFRENQVKNELTYEQMMDIPNELKYRGWSEPLEMALVAFLTRNHLLLKGGAGSGKTTMMRTIGAILNLGVITATGSRDASIETFIGFKEVQDGNIVVHEGAATRAATNGYIFVLEEGNAVMPSVLIQLHNLFDDTRQFYNEFTGETVYAHPHHVFATCINEGYEGTNELNRATKDRLMAIDMPYMAPEDLKVMLANYEAGYSNFQKELLGMDDVSKKDIIVLSEIAKALQQGVNDGILEPEIASIRNITDLFEVTRIYPIEKAIKMVLNKYDEEDRRQMMEILDTVDLLEFTASDILKIS